MLDQLKPLDTRRLYQQIADQIRALIRSDDFPPGSRLPPERDLAQRLGVSRPSVREALIALEIEGSVEIRMGAGVYALQPPPPRTEQDNQAMGESPMDLMQARAVLEGALAGMACARLDNLDDLQPARQAMQAMQDAVARGRIAFSADKDFHLAIARLSGNSVMERMVSELFDSRHSPISEQLSRRTETLASWEEAVQEHEAILAALENRDMLRAEAAMRTHLYASQQRWLAQMASAEQRQNPSEPPSGK